MNTRKLFWGIGIILLAVVLILDAFGLTIALESSVGEISLLALFGACMLTAYIISSLVKGKVSRIFIPLSLIFMLFEKNIAEMCGRGGESLINNWLLLGCALLLQFGFFLLLGRGHIKCSCDTSKLNSRSSRSFSASVQYVDAAVMKDEHAENDLGSLVIRFENTDKYQGGGTLHVENNLGSTVIEVPEEWRFTCNIGNNLGHVTAPKSSAGDDAPTLILVGENNLGSVVVKLV